jgi:hypothetical protein
LIRPLSVRVVPVPVPAGLREGRRAALGAAGDHEPLIPTGFDPLPAAELPSAVDPDRLAGGGQELPDLPDLPRPRAGGDGLPPPLRPAEVLPGLRQEAQHRPEPLLAPVRGVVARARPLDRSVDGAHRRVDVHRPHRHAQLPAAQGVVPHVGEVPQPLEPDTQQQQDPQHHAVPAPLRFPLRVHGVLRARLLDPEEVQERHQREQAADGRQPLRALPVGRLRGDSPGPRDIRFPGTARPLFSPPLCRTLTLNHRGYLLSAWPLCYPSRSYRGPPMVSQAIFSRSAENSVTDIISE